MSEVIKNFRHVALEQLKTLVDFMTQHPHFASGTLRTIAARHQNKQLWSELAKILNNRKGARKTFIGWSRYWSVWKNKLKRKVADTRRKKLCSDKKDIYVKPLTKIEKQALSILEPSFEKKRYIKPCDPLPMEKLALANPDHIYEDALPIEIKQESIIESAMLSNEHHNVIGVESEQSTQPSDEELVEDKDESSNQNLNDIYPKWLMEIEKKRADAELLRAKAEEQRSVVSAKTAEAMLIQAEAMKKLSEAAKVQADAMLRIAIVLENRSDELSIIQPRHLSGYH